MKWLALALVTAACATDLSALNPNIQVGPAPDDRGLVVSMVLDSGDPQLSAHATFRETTRALRYVGGGAYVATFPLDTPVNTDEPVEIDVEGTQMTVTAPPDLSVVVPLFISRSQATTLTWPITSADAMSWYATGACVMGAGAIPANASAVTFTDADWTQTATGTCTTELDIMRMRDAPLDPAFAGGTLSFVREVRAEFASTP